MGTWTCPKCGSRDAYKGSEVVSKYRRGPSVGIETEFGVAMSQPVNDSTEHKLKKVWKCRQCDTILKRKRNYEKSTQEINDEQRAAEIEEFKNKYGCFTWPIFLLIVLSFLGLLFGDKRINALIVLVVCIILLRIGQMVTNYRVRKKYGDQHVDECWF